MKMIVKNGYKKRGIMAKARCPPCVPHQSIRRVTPRHVPERLSKIRQSLWWSRGPKSTFGHARTDVRACTTVGLHKRQRSTRTEIRGVSASRVDPVTIRRNWVTFQPVSRSFEGEIEDIYDRNPRDPWRPHVPSLQRTKRTQASHDLNWKVAPVSIQSEVGSYVAPVVGHSRNR